MKGQLEIFLDGEIVMVLQIEFIHCILATLQESMSSVSAEDKLLLKKFYFSPLTVMGDKACQSPAWQRLYFYILCVHRMYKYSFTRKSLENIRPLKLVPFFLLSFFFTFL